MSLSTDYSSAQRHPDLTQLDLPQLNADARAVLEFWFDTSNESYWFVEDNNFDQQIADKFDTIWQAAKQGECATWRHNTKDGISNQQTDLAGRLAEIIVLDQFSRNLGRGQAMAFAQDTMALVLAQEAIHQAQFNTLPAQWRQFMIMPFMHSESAVIHQRYLSFFEQLNDAITLDIELKHHAIIEKFGRYPHRNEALGRKSTAEELAFLQQPNSSF